MLSMLKIFRHTNMFFLPRPHFRNPHTTEGDGSQELHTFHCPTIGLFHRVSFNKSILPHMWAAKKSPNQWGIFNGSRLAPRPRTLDMASMLRNLVETMKRHPGDFGKSLKSPGGWNYDTIHFTDWCWRTWQFLGIYWAKIVSSKKARRNYQKPSGEVFHLWTMLIISSWTSDHYLNWESGRHAKVVSVNLYH